MQISEEDRETAREGQTDTKTLSSGCRNECVRPVLETPGRGLVRDRKAGHLSLAPADTHTEHVSTARPEGSGTHREGQQHAVYAASSYLRKETRLSLSCYEVFCDPIKLRWERGTEIIYSST